MRLYEHTFVLVMYYLARISVCFILVDSFRIYAVCMQDVHTKRYAESDTRNGGYAYPRGCEASWKRKYGVQPRADPVLHYVGIA